MPRIAAAALLAALLLACAARPTAPDVGYRVERDLRYVPEDWAAPLYADLYRPVTRAQRAAIVLVHGGAWRSGERRDMDGIAARLAAHGFVVLNIDYRLAPAFRFPAPLEDLQQAVRWLRTHAAALDLDPARIGGWGYSAGGALVALQAALSPSDPNFDAGARLQAAVVGGAPMNLVEHGTDPVARLFIGAGVDEARERWRAASATEWISPDDPPMFLYHGRLDWVVDSEHSAIAKARLDAAGVPAELHLLAGLEHLGAFLLGGATHEAATTFLQQRLRGRLALAAGAR